MTQNAPVEKTKNNDTINTDGHSENAPATAEKVWDGELTDDEIQAEAALQKNYSGKQAEEKGKPDDAASTQ